MIISGYQGIGKSTLCKKDSRYIDLESSTFWVDGERSNDWFKVYVNIAANLSEQGYDVFISSHYDVRCELVKLRDKQKDPYLSLIIYPENSNKMKEIWINKLDERYKDTKLNKDYKALMDAKIRYSECTEEMNNFCIINHIGAIRLNNENYDLNKLIQSYKHAIGK